MSEFWVYENWTLHKAVLHRGECGACKWGRGQHGGGETKNGRWHGPYSSVDAARSPFVGGFRDSADGTLVEQATHLACPDQARCDAAG